ncbi:MAG: HAMP domain-containing sensor histidine kinase [Pseudobdellovibrio sp.]
MIKSVSNQLLIELSSRAKSAAYAFAVIAVFIFFDKFDAIVFGSSIQVLSSIVILCSIFRVYSSNRIMSTAVASEKNKYILYSSVVISSVAYSLIFSLAAYERGFSDSSALIRSLIMYSFVVGTPVTLSYVLSLQYFYVLITFVPQILIYSYLIMVGREPFHLGFIYVFIVATFYTIKQGHAHRKLVIEKILNELQLEAKNQELVVSQQQFLEQSVWAIHATRLASVGEMAAGMAHEINTPLAIISLRVDSLEQHLLFENKDQKVLKIIFSIRSAVDRIAKIVNGLRTYARQSEGDSKVIVNIDTLIRETLDFCQEKFKHNQINLIFNETVARRIECRSVQISQILINLLNNAFDAVVDLPMGERVIKIEVKQADKMIEILVSNSGPAIDKKTQEKLFQPFFTTKEIGKGTGLGLGISKNLANHHGGDLQYLPNLATTTFCLRLPIV